MSPEMRCLACETGYHPQCAGDPCACLAHDPVSRTAAAFATYLAELRDLVPDSVYAGLLPHLDVLAAVHDVQVPAPRERVEPEPYPSELPIHEETR